MNERLELERLKVERTKSLAGVASVFITAFFGTVVATWINAQIQQGRLDLERAQAEKEMALQEERFRAERRREEIKYLGEYLTYALEDSIERRFRFSEYFSHLTTDVELRGYWETYHAEVAEDFSKLLEIENQLRVAQQQEDQQRITQLEREIIELQRKVGNVAQPSPGNTFPTVTISPAVDQIIQHVIRWETGEGDFVQQGNSPSAFGIGQRLLSNFLKRAATADEVANLSMEQAKVIYYEGFAKPLQLEDLPEALWLPVMHASVLSGPGRAARILQSTLGDGCADVMGATRIPVDRDGTVGRWTLDCAARLAEARGAKALATSYMDRYETHLRSLSLFDRFGTAWLDRLATIRKDNPAMIKRLETLQQ